MAIPVPTNKPLIALYFAGGTGYNLGHKFSKLVKGNEILKETVRVSFVDASTANDTSDNTEENTVVLGTGKGSGKVRGENAAEIRACIPQVLHKFAPGVFNVNVGGASGGTGSTIINELSRHFMKEGMNCVNVMIGSLSSRSDIQNTHKTFQSFSLAAEKFERPAVVHFRQNKLGETRDEVDSNILNDLLLLCLLLSGKDDKADETDFANFLNYPKVTDFPNGVVAIDVFRDTIRLAKHETLYTVATLAKPGTSTDVTPTPDYQVAGYLNSQHTAVFDEINALHWCVIGNTFTPMMKDLEEKVEGFRKAAQAHRQEKFIPRDRDSDDDLVV